MRVRSDTAVLADRAGRNDGIIYNSSVADVGAVDSGVLADDAVLTDIGVADKCRARKKYRILADLNCVVDPRSVRVNDLDAVSHVAVKDPVIHDVSYLGELDPVIDTPGIVKIAYNGAYGVAVADKDSDRICEIVLLLRVVSADPAQC